MTTNWSRTALKNDTKLIDVKDLKMEHLNEEQIKQFLSEYDDVVRPFQSAHVKSIYTYETNMTDYNRVEKDNRGSVLFQTVDVSEFSVEQLQTFPEISSRQKFASRIHRINASKVTDYGLRKQLRQLRSFSFDLMSKEDEIEYSTVLNNMKMNYMNARFCDYRNETKCNLEMEPGESNSERMFFVSKCFCQFIFC